MTTVAFFQSGSDTPYLQGVKSAKYPYSVSLNPAASSPTLNDAEILLASAQAESLKDRVQVDPATPNVEIVDKFFRLELNDKAPRKLALKSWGDLQWKSKVVGYGSGIVAVGLTLIALQGAPVYILVALYVSTVAFTCLAGWSLHRYHVADKQLAVWQRPGEDFAQKRKAALELQLPEMIQKKCHFHPDQPTGTLLGVEMFSVFRREFKQFATPLLDRKCDTPAQQHQWVLDFFKGNPFAVKFFEGNPHLASERGWEDVQKFQKQIDQLLELMKILKESYVPQFNKNLEVVEEKYKAIQKSFSENAQVSCDTLELAPLRAKLYRRRVFDILKKECLDNIYAIYTRHKGQAEYPCSTVYPQVRALLEEAQKGLLADQSYTLDATAFADAGKLLPKNFQEELDAVTASYPKNVIDKAKAEAPKEVRQEYTDAYFRFIDAAFSS